MADGKDVVVTTTEGKSIRPNTRGWGQLRHTRTSYTEHVVSCSET